MAFRKCEWVCIESAEEREFGNDLQFVWLAAINNGGVKVEELTAVSKEDKFCKTLLKVKKGDFFAISGLRRNTTRSASESEEIRLSSASGCKIFSVGSHFTYDEKIVDKYRHPEDVPLKDVKTSPLKRRLSVTGVVTGAIDERGSAKKRVKEFGLDDGSSDDPVRVCLWGDKASLQLCVGEELTIGPLSVSLDRREMVRKLHSVQDTTLDRKRHWTCTVIAVSDPDEYPMDLLIQGGGCITVERSYDVSFRQLPLTILIERSGNEIISISAVDLEGVDAAEDEV